MLITIGSAGNTINDKVAKRFGHAEYYLTYNDENDELEVIKNNDEDHTHTELQNLVNKGINVFIVGNIGPHAFEILKEGGAKVYLARKMIVEEAIKNYKTNNLKELTESTVKKSINHSD